MQHPPIPASIGTAAGGHYPVVAWLPLDEHAARVAGEAVAVLWRRRAGEGAPPYAVVHLVPRSPEGWQLIGGVEDAESIGEATTRAIAKVTHPLTPTFHIPDDALPDANERALQRGLG